MLNWEWKTGFFGESRKRTMNDQMPMSVSGGEFKREYEFYWSLNFPGAMEGKDERSKLFKKFVGINQTSLDYVSRMAKSVALASLELDEDEIDIGDFKYPIPKQVKYGKLKATYLDDFFETAYNLHKTWIQLCGSGAVPLIDCCLEGNYFNSTSMGEDLLDTVFGIKIGGSIVTSRIGDTIIEEDEGYTTPYNTTHIIATSHTRYVHIYPTSVSRSDANKEGKGLATVTVEYAQLFEPKLQADKSNSHNYYKKLADELGLNL